MMSWFFKDRKEVNKMYKLFANIIGKLLGKYFDNKSGKMHNSVEIKMHTVNICQTIFLATEWFFKLLINLLFGLQNSIWADELLYIFVKKFPDIYQRSKHLSILRLYMYLIFFFLVKARAGLSKVYLQCMYTV